MLRILTYHRIADPEATPDLDPAQVSATPEVFREQMLYLSRRYRTVSLDDVLRTFRSGAPLPRRAVLLTFDDAYRDFAQVAWPILRELELSATLFVPTAYPGHPERSFWWDRLHRALAAGADGRFSGNGGNGPRGHADDVEVARVKVQLKSLPHEEAMGALDRLIAASPRELGGPCAPSVLSWEELRTLRLDGVCLGAHTRTHPALTRVPDARVRSELRGSLEDLRARLGEVPAVISYPYGYHDSRVARIAREQGFELGFTNLDGLNRLDRVDPLRLGRTNITRRTTPLRFRLRMHPWFAPVDRWRDREERRRATASGGGVRS